LPGADLQAANFSWSSLCGANLRNADLMGASFERTNLMGVDLQGANLAGANLAWPCCMERACKGRICVSSIYEAAALKYARYDETTLWPEVLIRKNAMPNYHRK
jgi:uncharacterized protein YjbI with pentapeptide repeats